MEGFIAKLDQWHPKALCPRFNHFQNRIICQ